MQAPAGAGLREIPGVVRPGVLLEYLPDTRGVIGLGVLRSPRAVPVLTGLFDAEGALPPGS